MLLTWRTDFQFLFPLKTSNKQFCFVFITHFSALTLIRKTKAKTVCNIWSLRFNVHWLTNWSLLVGCVCFSGWGSSWGSWRCGVPRNWETESPQRSPSQIPNPDRTPPEQIILLQGLLASKMLVTHPSVPYIIGFLSMWTGRGHFFFVIYLLHRSPRKARAT